MNVKQAIDSRVSSRYLIKDKLISEADLRTVLEAGLKAPSGFGVEPWKFYVVENKQEELFEASYYQPHVKTAPYMIVVTYMTESYVDAKPEFLESKFAKSGFDQEKIEMYISTLKKRGLEQYFREQCFFAVSQMVLQARGLGLDTCVMGGFVEDAILDIIEVDKVNERVSVIFTLGYSDVEPKKRSTRDFDDVVVFKK